ncbi:Cwf18 pre-mRNA splicing factor [Necator americanus]|uniref:Cwf18 pre-mRNA splicing factor n=1 Tax=Necator americanus TaxID=51031 RepID=W2THL0_NECAM|nr:Cwf18 pre-mRNA splicing factor [Necator americanus]ETN80671.1 Cwf18 pre-mRNA splicing factor [Necator americanus]
MAENEKSDGSSDDLPTARYVCFREEDYEEEEQATKKSKSEEKLFRSYQPISNALGKVEQPRPKLDIVEEVIASHLEDTKNTKAVETVDLSTLAPKKIDWDLKRDIEARLQKLERRTQKCIAELIRQRLAEGKGDLASTVNAGV